MLVVQKVLPAQALFFFVSCCPWPLLTISNGPVTCHTSGPYWAEANSEEKYRACAGSTIYSASIQKPCPT